MHLKLFLCFIFVSDSAVSMASDLSTRDFIKLLNLFIVQRGNNILENDDDIIERLNLEEDLPQTEPIKPGHSLIQPSVDMLESAANYPQKDISGTAVYGNIKNLGLSYGNTNERLSYGSFRKSNLLATLLQAIENIQKQSRYKRNPYVVVIEIDPTDVNQEKEDKLTDEENINIENDASEILNDFEFGEEGIGTRRKSNKRKNSKYRNRDSAASSSSESSSSSSDDSSDYERNPGNPFTVHTDKYKQNWLWNHFMDGDHMNVNPYAPQFSSGGPSGPALFFGRKWWYFNQDDYKPLH